MIFLFRTDASVAIGTGHVMRCLALAQAMRDVGASVIFLSSGLEGRLHAENMEVIAPSAAPSSEEDARATARLAKERKAQWVVVDGYGFDAAYQAALKREECNVLFIDDYGHAGSYSANLVLNQNVSAREEWYGEREPPTRLLLGPQYALLRREFRAWKQKRTARSGEVRNILVTLGGADPGNVTAKVIRAIEKTTYAGSVTVVAGGTNPHKEELQTLAAASVLPIRLIIDASTMPTLMAEADMAIATGGTTGWELLFMGVPFLTGAFAENQRAVAAALGEQNFADTIGWYPDATEEDLAHRIGGLISDTERRMMYSRKGMDMIDGDGVMRVLSAMEIARMTLRDAMVEDAALLFGWANDPSVRQSSFSPEPILWDDHRAWLERKLADPRCHMFIGMDGAHAIGQIRFDIRGDGEAEIDVHVAPDARGKGYGTSLIQQGLRRLFDTTHVNTVHAYAKADNDASQKSFLKAGFGSAEQETLHGHEVYHFISHRS